MQAQKFTKETIKNIGVTERNFPEFRAGDTIRITTRVVEGGKERMQDFQGLVIGAKGAGITKTFRVRKLSAGVAVERIFPYHSPNIVSISLVSSAQVRRAKLYYMRKRTGSAAYQVD